MWTGYSYSWVNEQNSLLFVIFEGLNHWTFYVVALTMKLLIKNFICLTDVKSPCEVAVNKIFNVILLVCSWMKRMKHSTPALKSKRN